MALVISLCFASSGVMMELNGGDGTLVPTTKPPEQHGSGWSCAMDGERGWELCCYMELLSPRDMEGEDSGGQELVLSCA